MTCCPQESLPTLTDDHTPTGKEIDLDGLKCYTNGTHGEKAVIVYYDIFGYSGGRTKSICDQIANSGYYVVLPDIYHGDAWNQPTLDKVQDFLKKFPWDPMIRDDTDKVLAHLQSVGVKSIGTVGFCAGAFSVFHLFQGGGNVVCGASMHPSVQLCNLFGTTPEVLAEGLKCPQLVYPAGGDPDMYKEGGTVYDILKSKFGDANDMKEFADMGHGWMTRGDLSNPQVKRDVQIAMDGLIKFFSKHI